MDIQVEDSSFGGRQLMVRTATFFRGATLWIDGDKAPKGPWKSWFKPTYILKDNSGKEVIATLKINPFDPIPTLMLDDRSIQLARPLTWYEYVWMAFPILLIAGGGAIGGLFGYGAAHFNAQVFRSERKTWQKYVLTGLVSFATMFIFLIIAGVIETMVHPDK